MGKKSKNKIDKFRNQYYFLSNFYPCQINYKGIIYPSVEHAFQAAKVISYRTKIKISQIENPGSAKSYARKCKIRKDWEKIKVAVMSDILLLKFQDKSLFQQLKNTGNKYIEEGNYWHDNFWGNCYCQKCKKINGKNILGKILMTIREKTKGEE